MITRPAQEAARTAALVQARGFVPVVAPLLNVRHFSLTVPGRVQAVLVTSGNALAGLPLMQVPLLAVGDATAARARAAGFSDVHSAAGDADALLALAVRELRPGAGPLLLVCGRGQAHDLAAALRAENFPVIRRVTYAAAPVAGLPTTAADALQGGSLHAALFLSAETAHIFVRLLPPPLAASVENVVALAIGNLTADALKPLPWRQVRLASFPTLDDVLALL
ncbi:MAG: uroporphyrinogen-III synthase [Rhodospirillales bacterium]